MEIKMQFAEPINGILESPNGNRYLASSIEGAVNRFNAKCPKSSGILNRKNIERPIGLTHIINKLRFVDNCIIADISIDTHDVTIRPIILSPLQFSSGDNIKEIIDIYDICIER